MVGGFTWRIGVRDAKSWDFAVTVNLSILSWSSMFVHFVATSLSIGKEKKPTIVLEAVADCNLWIWHAFFGMPGSCNDLNVLDNSPLVSEIFAGRFPPPVGYVVNGKERVRGYYLADGIYPKWSIFVQ